MFVLLCVPESPAWQVERGETKEEFRDARKTLTKVAKINGVTEIKG